MPRNSKPPPLLRHQELKVVDHLSGGEGHDPLRKAKGGQKAAYQVHAIPSATPEEIARCVEQLSRKRCPLPFPNLHELDPLNDPKGWQYRIHVE